MARTRNLLLIVTLAVALAACGGQPPVQPDPDPVPPEISAVAPSVAPRGATIVITGADFGTDGSVTIGGVAAAITSWSDDEIQAVVAAGTPDAWQEVEVTTDEGADAFSPFFVGVAFTGAAADLQDFLDGQTAGTAVLLEAAAYDLSAAPDELLIDNRSLYGRGEAATSLAAPNGAIVLADFGATVTVADLTLQTDELAYFHGTLAGTLGTVSVSSMTGAQSPLELGTRTIALPAAASLPALPTHAQPTFAAPLAGLEAIGVDPPPPPLANGVVKRTEVAATTFDQMPEVTVAPAGVAFPRITFANVTLLEDAGGGFFGLPIMAIPAVELTLSGVTVDGPNTVVYLLSSQDMVVEGADVTADVIFLASVAGSVSVGGSSLLAGSGVNLLAESGLSVTASTVRAANGDVEILGAVLALAVGTGLDTGGPVTIAESSIEALDADLADANDVGQLLVRTQFAPIVLRDNVLIRSHLDTVILNEASFIGEGNVTLTGNAAVRVGVSQADDPVNYRPSAFEALTGVANVPTTLTLVDNAIDATGAVITIAGGGEPGNLVASGNDLSAGDGFGTGGVIMISGSPGTLTLASNAIASDDQIVVIAPDLDGGSAEWDGNTMAAIGDASPSVLLMALDGSCAFRDNDVTADDVGADDASTVVVQCVGIDPNDDTFDMTGNAFAAAGNGGSIVMLQLAGGTLNVAGNALGAEVQLFMQFANAAGTIADNAVALGPSAVGWLLEGDAGTDLALADNAVGYVDVVGYGLLLRGIGNAELSGNQVSSTGTPAPGTLALGVVTTGGGTPVAITASGNTFTNFDRALVFGDQAGAAIGIDATVSGNVFDFVIDAVPEVADLFNVADEIDARNNQWGTNTVLATVASYVKLSGDTIGQGGSILLDPITLP